MGPTALAPDGPPGGPWSCENRWYCVVVARGVFPASSRGRTAQAPAGCVMPVAVTSAVVSPEDHGSTRSCEPGLRCSGLARCDRRIGFGPKVVRRMLRRARGSGSWWRAGLPNLNPPRDSPPSRCAALVKPVAVPIGTGGAPNPPAPPNPTGPFLPKAGRIWNSSVRAVASRAYLKQLQESCHALGTPKGSKLPTWATFAETWMSH